jgi:pimeloyl-ACP methyl ester carboxylesterase
MYLIICVAMIAFQTSLIFPGSFRKGAPETVLTANATEELVHLKTPDGTPIVGFFGKADGTNPTAPPTPRPTVLYFYGNGDCMASALAEFHMFRRLGLNCMIVDYPGYGMSQGSPSEQGCYAAAEAAYQFILTRPDVDAKKIISAGWSLGGAVAVEVAHRHRNDGTIAGLLTFSSFTSMLDMAKQSYPFLPVGLLLAHHFKSEDKLREITVPYFLGHGRIDPGIPFAHADRLAKAYAGRPETLTRFTAEGAGHNDFFDIAGGGADEPLEKAIGQFLKRLESRL